MNLKSICYWIKNGHYIFQGIVYTFYIKIWRCIMSLHLKNSKTFQEVLKEVQKEYKLKPDLKVVLKASNGIDYKKAKVYK